MLLTGLRWDALMGLSVIWLGLSCAQAKYPSKPAPHYDRAYFEAGGGFGDHSGGSRVSSSEQTPEDFEELVEKLKEIEKEVQDFINTTSMQTLQCHYTTSAIKDALKIHYIYQTEASPMSKYTGHYGYDKFLTRLDPDAVLIKWQDRHRLSQQHGPNLPPYIDNHDCAFIHDSYDFYVKQRRHFHNRLQTLLAVSDDFTELSRRFYAEDQDGTLVRFFEEYIAPEFLLAADEDFATVSLRVSRDWRLKHKVFKDSYQNIFSWQRYEIFLDSFLASLDSASGYSNEDQLILPARDFGLHFRRGNGYLEIEAIVADGIASASPLQVGDRIVGLVCHDSRSLCEDQTKLHLTQVSTGDFLRYMHLKNHDQLELIILRAWQPNSFYQHQVKLTQLKQHERLKVTSHIKHLNYQREPGEVGRDNDNHDNDNNHNNSDHHAMKIGVIKIPEFYHYHQPVDTPMGESELPTAAEETIQFESYSSYDELKAILESFITAEVDGIVLDLRDNAGGPLAAAAPVLSLFLQVEHGFQYVLGPSHRDELYVVKLNTPEFPQISTQPLVVLVNRATASLAELMAQTLQVHGRAIVVGDSATSGKATIQSRFASRQIRPDEKDGQDESLFQITTGQFFSVFGESLQGSGVWSDVVIPSLTEHLVFPHSSRPNLVNYGYTLPPVLEHDASTRYALDEIAVTLQQHSLARVTSHEPFKLIHSLSARIHEHINREDVELKEIMYNRAWNDLEKLLIQGQFISTQIDESSKVFNDSIRV